MGDTPSNDLQTGQGALAAGPSKSGSFDMGGLSPAEVATQLFLADMKQRVESAANETKREAIALGKREAVIFSMSIVTGIVGVVSVVGGIALIAMNYIAIAALSGGVGLLASAGTVGFRQAASQTGARREALSSREIEEGKVLRAIGVTLMIEDGEERNRRMVDLATRMTEAVGVGPTIRTAGRAKSGAGRASRGRGKKATSGANDEKGNTPTGPR